jgi:mono/diheme cytochrome c family protein
MRIVFGFGVMLAVVSLAACGGEDTGGGPGKSSSPGAGAPAANASSGAGLFALGCAPCHGARGEGTQLGSALNDRKRDVQQVIQTVQAGVPNVERPHVPMPARGDGSWTDQQVRTVSEYAASLAR